MKFSILISLLFFASSSFAGEPLKSTAVKKVIDQAIIDFADEWDLGDPMGKIWVRLNRDEDTYVVIQQSRNKLKVEVDFTCGSEYDESEHSGYCTLTATKVLGSWKAKVNICGCAD